MYIHIGTHHITSCAALVNASTTMLAALPTIRGRLIAALPIPAVLFIPIAGVEVGVIANELDVTVVETELAEGPADVEVDEGLLLLPVVIEGLVVLGEGVGDTGAVVDMLEVTVISGEEVATVAGVEAVEEAGIATPAVIEARDKSAELVRLGEGEGEGYMSVVPEMEVALGAACSEEESGLIPSEED